MAVSRQISRSISLTSLACELIHAIAFYVALPTDPFNVKPPSHLIALLLASRAFYSTLNYRDNPYLYARIFRATFDTSALYRRFPASLITAPALAEELIRRWTILSRIRWRTSSEPFLWNRRRYRTEIAVEELLMSFILFTESDGPNARILTNYARIEKYLQSYQYLVVNPMHQDPRMPEESHETSLWLWLNWFTLDYSECTPPPIPVLHLSNPFCVEKAMCEESDVRGNMQDFILLPYVLGTFKVRAFTVIPPTPPIDQAPTPHSTRTRMHPTSISTFPSLPRHPPIWFLRLIIILIRRSCRRATSRLSRHDPPHLRVTSPRSSPIPFSRRPPLSSGSLVFKTVPCETQRSPTLSKDPSFPHRSCFKLTINMKSSPQSAL